MKLKKNSAKVEILIPKCCISEQKYILDILFGEFLGLGFSLATHNESTIKLYVHDSAESLTVNADFFHKSGSHWLKPESMPKLPLHDWNPREEGLDVRLIKETVPVLYGHAGLIKEANHWHINLDIFGSAFFMLSRYEELITQSRDVHDRFPASASVAFKAGFLDRPIVNEYLEILWACMYKLWPSLTRETHQPQTFVSCDVDQPFDCTVETISKLTRSCAGDVLKRKAPALALKRIKRYFFNEVGVYKFDQNYSFDWYMDLCEQVGIKAAFYFIPTSVETNNGCYELTDKKIIWLMQMIDKRGHEIGVHGSFQTYRDEEKLVNQKELLVQTLAKSGIKQKIQGNRQHYLRWESAITPGILAKAGFKYDTTGGYADQPGFRFGTAHEFYMWGWQDCKMLKLRQRPLIVMECTILEKEYMGLTGDAAYNTIMALNEASKKYGGNFSLLWHNSSLCSVENKNLFSKVLYSE